MNLLSTKQVKQTKANATTIVAKDISTKVNKLVSEGKAKSFLVEHGFVTPTGKLPKRYGG